MHTFLRPLALKYCTNLLDDDHPRKNEEKEAHGVDGKEYSALWELCTIEEVH